MNESEIENSDPFLAISDYSENEKAIQDINAFLNAPSSVVVKKKSNNQIDHTYNPSASAKNTPNKNNSFNTPGNSNQPSSPKKGSIQFESSVFELPSFDSDESSENGKKVINDFNPLQNNHNINKSGSITSNSDRKKDTKRSPYPKKNLLSNQELINAFLTSDNTNKNNIDNKNEGKSNFDINKKPKNEDEQKIANNEINRKEKKENEEKIIEQTDNKDNKNSKQKRSSPLDFLDKLDLDATEVDPDKDETHPINKDEPENHFLHQNSYLTTPTKQKRQFYYITPKSPIEAFEYSFMCYLEDASDDLRIRFSDEFQIIVEENLNFQNNVQSFILNLNQELRSIIDDETSTLDLDHSHLEYDTDYISTFFQSLSSSLKSTDIQLDNPDNLNNITQQILDLNDVTINADLIQSLSSSFVNNSKSILSELQNNLTELSNIQSDFKLEEKVRIQGIYRQKMQMRFDLEAQERQLSIEHDYLSKRLENLNKKNNLEMSDSFILSPYSTLSEFENLPNYDDLNQEIDEIIGNLKKFDSKKVTSPFTSFSQKVKLIADELLILNTQLSGKTRMVSRSLPLGNKNNFMPSAMQPSKIMKMHFPYNYPNFDFSENLFQDQFSNEYSGLQNNSNYFMNSNSKIANKVRERLANIKQLREDQITEVHELISDNQ